MTEAEFKKAFPSKLGRDAGDEAIDSIPTTEPMHVFIDAWEAAYFKKTGTSPMRESEDD